MITVTIYKTNTGEIVGNYGGRAESVAANVPPDCSYIVGAYKSHFYKIVDGEPVRKSQSELEQIHSVDILAGLRDQRDYELSRSDWTQSPDSPLTDAKKEEWRTYRQALRDLPANTTDPANPIWPIQPS